MDLSRDRVLDLGRLIVLALVLSFLFLLFAPDTALADKSSSTGRTVVAQEVQDSPYQPPVVEEVLPPSWLAPFGPLAQLPLWAVAAVLSVTLAGLVIILPMVVRWIWTLGSNGDSRTRP